jgi:hypothetical protein
VEEEPDFSGFPTVEDTEEEPDFGEDVGEEGEVSDPKMVEAMLEVERRYKEAGEVAEAKAAVKAARQEAKGSTEGATDDEDDDEEDAEADAEAEAAADAKMEMGRGCHSCTFQINPSRFAHICCAPLSSRVGVNYAPNVSHKLCLR